VRDPISARTRPELWRPGDGSTALRIRTYIRLRSTTPRRVVVLPPIYVHTTHSLKSELLVAGYTRYSNDGTVESKSPYSGTHGARDLPRTAGLRPPPSSYQPYRLILHMPSRPLSTTTAASLLASTTTTSSTFPSFLACPTYSATDLDVPLNPIEQSNLHKHHSHQMRILVKASAMRATYPSCQPHLPVPSSPCTCH